MNFTFCVVLVSDFLQNDLKPPTDSDSSFDVDLAATLSGLSTMVEAGGDNCGDRTWPGTSGLLGPLNNEVKRICTYKPLRSGNRSPGSAR